MSDLSATLHEWHLVNHRFVGYVRAADESDLQDQFAELENYAKKHGLKIAQTFYDIGRPV